MNKIRIFVWFFSITLLLCALCIVYFVGKKGLENIETGIIGLSIAVCVCLAISTLLFYVMGMHSGRGEARESLPNRAKFKKLYESRKENKVKFLTDSTYEDEFFCLPANILLDKDGKELKEIPEEFRVAKSKRITEETRLNKRPKTETIYYLLPIEKDK